MRVVVLEPEKRAVAAVADYDEVRSVCSVDIAMDHAISMQMLFDPGHSLDERILREQFGIEAARGRRLRPSTGSRQRAIMCWMIFERAGRLGADRRVQSGRCCRSSRRHGRVSPAAAPARRTLPRTCRRSNTRATASSPPFRANGHYQTAGTIEKDTPEKGIKEHRFIRADTHQSKEDAVAFVISKAKQIIDLQGDHMFASPHG